MQTVVRAMLRAPQPDSTRRPVADQPRTDIRLLEASAQRQPHARDATLGAEAVLERNAAAVVLDDLARQHEADAGAVRLRREERHPKVVGARDAGPVVLHLDDDGAAVAV